MAMWRGLHAIDAVTELMADEAAIGAAAAFAVEEELTMAAGRLAREATVPVIPAGLLASQVTVVWTARAQIPILAAAVLARAIIAAYKGIANEALAAMFLVCVYNKMVLAALQDGLVLAGATSMALDAILDLEPDHTLYDGDGNPIVVPDDDDGPMPEPRLGQAKASKKETVH